MNPEDKEFSDDLERDLDQEFFGEFRDRISVDPFDEDDDAPEDLNEKEPRHMTTAVWFAVLLGIVIAVLVGWETIGSRTPADGERVEIPLIKRDSAAVKVRPDDPGGMDVPDRDKLVYNRIGSHGTSEDVERLLPVAERPVLPPSVADALKNTAEPKAGQTENLLAKQEVPAPVAVQRPRTKVVNALATPKKVEPAPVKKAPTDAPVVKKTAPAEKVVKAAPAKAPVTATSTAPVAGDYQVQLLSLKSKAAAEKAWTTILRKHKSLLSSQPADIVRADLGAKGVFYRLRTGAFKQKAAASALCKSLTAAKQGCFVVRKK